MSPDDFIRNPESDPKALEVGQQSRTIAEQAAALEVRDDATNDRALSMLVAVRQQVKETDALRREFTDPLNAHVKKINSFFGAMTDALKEADDILADKTTAYRAMVEEAQRKRDQAAREVSERRQAMREARAAKEGREAPAMIPVVTPSAPPPKTVTTSSGAKVTFRTEPQWEITDPAAIPEEYKTIDTKKIGAAVRSGLASELNPIPGVRIWTLRKPVTRG